MAINFSTAAYLPAFNTFARPVTITPLVSQPLEPAYASRGIFDTMAVDVTAEDGTIFSDQRTILDVLDAEFTVLPMQGDRVTIPGDSGMPARGDYEITDTDANGFETTLTLRRIVETKP